MKGKRTSRILSIVLLVAMMLTLMPATAFASTVTTWTETSLEDIAEGDTIAITMKVGDVYYVLPTRGAGNDGQPLAIETGTVSEGVLSTEAGAADLGWTVKAVEGGYTISTSAGLLLRVENVNNGVRIGEDTTGSVWNQVTTENGTYLSAADSDSAFRYLGIYSATDWRCYKNTTGNIKDQTVGFWKLSGTVETGGDEPEPVLLSKYTEAPGEGDKLVIHHPGSNMALTANASGKKLAGVSATPAENELALSEKMAYMTVHVSENVYTFELDGTYLTAAESGSGLSFGNDGTSTLAQWTLTKKDNGSWVLMNVGANYQGAYNQALEYYSGFTTYGVKETDAYFFDFYGEAAAAEKTGLVTDLADLTDGAYVVIYNEGHSLALTSDTYQDWYLLGAAATIENGQVTEPDAKQIWKVTVNADGSYTFTQGDYTVAIWLSDSFLELTNNAAYNDATASGWFLESCNAENGKFYMYSSTLEGGNGKAYIEAYYKKQVSGDTFCAYSPTEDKLTEKDYGMQFYLVPAPEAEPDEPTPDSNSYGLTSSLKDGDTVILYNAANGVALGNSVASYKVAGVALTPENGVITTEDETVAWTVHANEDGTYRFTQGDLCLGGTVRTDNDKTYNNIAVTGATYTNWTLTGPDAEDFNYYLYLGEMASSYGSLYLEYYKGFTLYGSSSPDKEKFGITFYKQGAEPETPEGPPAGDDGSWDGILNKGEQYVIYNASAEGVMGIPNEMNIALSLVSASIEDGKAVVSNGAMVFTVADNPGRYYVFEAGGRYLATNDSEALFFQESVDDYAKWYLTKNGDGYILYNKTANYNGSPVCIEFFSGSFSGWTFKSANADIFRMNFYPLAENTAVVDGVAQVPQVKFDCEDQRYVGQDYEGAFTLDDLAPEISSVAIGYIVGDNSGSVTDFTAEGKTYSFTIPAAALDGMGAAESFTLNVSAANSYGLSYQGVKTVAILDEPFIGRLNPAPNAQTLEDKRPVISAEIGNVGENAVFTMTVNDEPVDAVYADGVLSYQAAEDMEDGRYTVIVTAERADGKSVEKMWSFTVGKAQYQLFFGQLHSHTTYSDGSGSLEAALDYVSAIPKSANVQFVAFTDHSNYFDTTGSANPAAALYDASQMTEESTTKWNSYRSTVAAFNARQSEVVGIAGFEMTWSGGPGHINTFNTPGIVSRNNSTLNNKTSDAGMKAYYETLNNEALVDSLNQFNHPGKTFGTFSDFSYWDPVTDSRFYLVEVGNGEGQIGAGGYYPSYEQYIVALDKGWHLAPSNNQDNHKGKWGNANDARDVILTDDFSVEGLYSAIRQYRVYATEDKNLEIQYSVNDLPLGSIITEVPEELSFSVSFFDPDSSDSISKVELVANSGTVAYAWTDPSQLATGLLEVSLKPEYSYYFVRVTEADGDLAVTAPVWVGESLKLGISSVECGTSTPVTGEEFTLTTTFFNSESSDATVKSVVYTVNGSEVIGVNSEELTVTPKTTAAVEFKYTPTKAKIMTITVTAVVELEGKEFTFSKDIELEVKDADSLVYIGIDASHYNEYVAGNYKDSMGNFGALAAGYGVRTVELKSSEELIAACANEKFVALIFTAPSRRLPAAQSDPRTYSAEELAAVAAFNANGGQVIVCGWGDNYEDYPVITGNPEIKHMAQTQNELLAALGSSIRVGDDEVMDDELNGGQAQRLYFSSYNFDSFLLKDVDYDAAHPNDRLYTELYSNYGGCSVFFNGSGVPATVTPIVYGHASTYTKDCDEDGKNDLVYPFGDGNRVVVMASEELPDKGLIIVSGAAFMSNFEVQATVEDTAAEKNYSNYKICENLVKGYNEITITPIAEVQKQTETGLVFTIEGTVSSNASGYDKDTAFFDCIYVQDATGGVCCFPVSGNYKIGDVVRITGYVDFYQAELELQVMSIEKIGETDPVEPKLVTAAQINDKSVLGSLVTLKGTVESFEYENDLVQTIMVRDADGDLARVFIDGYITTAEDVKDLAVGCQISATGLSSYDDTWKDTDYFPRIRVRSRADIVCGPSEARVAFKSLSLSGKIAINYYLELPMLLLDDAKAYVSVSGEKLPLSAGRRYEEDGKTYYIFTVYVKFAQLTEERLLRVYDGKDQLVPLLDQDGTDITETGFRYSGQTYIEAARAVFKEEKLLAVINALSDMGSLAQKYFDYNADTRVEVVGDLSAVTAESLSKYAAKVEKKENAGLSYVGSSLLLREDTEIRHYFKVSGGIEQFSFTVDGRKVTPILKDGYYYVPISNINAKNLDKSFHVEVSSASSGVIVSIDYCALSYAYSKLNKGETGDLADLLRGLAIYNSAADEYFGS